MTQTSLNAPPALIARLQAMEERFFDLQQRLNDPAVLANSQLVVSISRETGGMGPVVALFGEFKKAQAEVEDLQKMQEGTDAEMAELARAETAGSP